jgi:hypothetical protein
VFAALAMHAAIRAHADDVRRTQGIAVQMRVGLNSGEVVVRAISNDLHMDYSAIGQTVHLAARMEQLAHPGSTLLTADTLRLVEGLVQVTALGPIPVKGLSDPVEVFELIGASALRRRFQAATARGLTPFVGRQQELDAVHPGYPRPFRREGRATQERAEALIALCTEHGSPFCLALATILRGWALATQGQTAEAIAPMRQGLAAARATGAEMLVPYCLALLAEVCGHAGQADEGLRLLAEALAVADHDAERWYEAELYRLKGSCCWRNRRPNHPTRKPASSTPSSSQALSTPKPGSCGPP